MADRWDMTLVYNAPDTRTANLLMASLASAGIEAALIELEPNPYARGSSRRYVGEVLVPAEQEADAVAVVRCFESQMSGDDSPPFSEEELAAEAEASYDPNV